MEKARQLHQQGCNCCQAVVMAYADQLPISEENAMNMAAPFGRGLSGCRELCDSKPHKPLQMVGSAA